MRSKGFSIGLRATVLIFIVTLFGTRSWAATETVLHNFLPEYPNGIRSDAGLIFDGASNLYGTTERGGRYDRGTVFELTPQAGGGWTEHVLHSFGNGTDGAFPVANLIFDAAGNLYGTTSYGGTYNAGTAFELTPTAAVGWSEKVLHSFHYRRKLGIYDGSRPEGSLIFDAAGNLYGTTYYGGTGECLRRRCRPYGAGTVFELTPQPGGGWTENILYSFNGTNGTFPVGGLIFDGAGNLYGATAAGGRYDRGTVFELTAQAGGGWAENVLYSFKGGADGNAPSAGLVFDHFGNLYGTTYKGGTGGIKGRGTVFELTPQTGGGWTEKVLHGFGNGTDGADPEANLILDGSGNLYGTTIYGGAYGIGTVFELTPQAGGGWTENVLYSFGSGTDGSYPEASLIFDGAGNLYATTPGGSYGTVFELTPQAGGGWAENVLYTFNRSGADGANPVANLIFDAAGNLYGTSLEGGAYGTGAVFELTPQGGGGWTENLLYSFGNGTDGSYPEASLIFDAAGNLYGTSTGGGSYGAGTVFELTPQAGGGWTEKVLYSFGNGTDAYEPEATLIFDAAGNLYGTTIYGGAYGIGTVFELTPQAGGGWTEKVLHSFGNGTDGSYPNASLIFDAAGNLYGTTSDGGTHAGGTVFELTPQAGGIWTENVLHSFSGTDGADPEANLIFDAAGNLYGTTSDGGTHAGGTVFELTPQAGGGWTENVLYSFGDGMDGSYPEASLIFDAAGNLYGTTTGLGIYGDGTVFELKPEAGGWTEKVLHRFRYHPKLEMHDGSRPAGSLIFDAAGNLYGTTNDGGAYGTGTAFEITP